MLVRLPAAESSSRSGGAPVLETLRSHNSRWLVARYRGSEQEPQDNHRKASVPFVRYASPVRYEIDGVDLRQLDLASWRARVAAVFRTFIRLDCRCAENVAPAGAPDEVRARRP